MRSIVSILFAVLSLVIARPLRAQELKEGLGTVIKAVKVHYDSAYISKPRRLTVRLFGGRNYITEKYIDNKLDNTLKYQANTPVNVGLGASYRGLGVNFGFRTGLVKKYERYGKTKSFDLSTQLFLPKIAVDIYASHYKGYYITNPESVLNTNSEDAAYVRPDLRTTVIGINGEYILNAKRFSFSSPFSQTQHQKKSAGSFLFGAGAFAILVKADSSVIPTNIDNSDFFRGARFDRSGIYSIVINGGYAYTLVIHQNYFVSGSLNLGGGLSYTTLRDAAVNDHDGKLGTQLNLAFRLGAGYNSDKYFAGIQYIQLTTRNVVPVTSARTDHGAGSLKVVFAKRFRFKQKTIDHAINSIIQ
jgi:hypothetical protein